MFLFGTNREQERFKAIMVKRLTAVKRAALMNTGPRKRSQVVVGDEDADVGFNQLMLMSLIVDVTCLAKNVERMKVQVFALAKENDVFVPSEEED